MLYILGGASRSGKSITTHRLLKEKQISFFSTDFLMMGFQKGLPEYGVRSEDPDYEVAKKLWPVLRGIMTTLIEIRQEYLIEGVALLPKNIRDLIEEKGEGEIKSCFVGYAYADAHKKLEDIRKYKEGPNDWTKYKPDEYILEFIKGQIAYSKQLEEECKQYKIKYLDISDDFNGTIEELLKYLS